MSWKVENIGTRGRAFIANPDDFEQGGELTIEKKHKVLHPGKTAIVVDKVGEIWSTYKEIRVISKPKKKE